MIFSGFATVNDLSLSRGAKWISKPPATALGFWRRGQARYLLGLSAVVLA